MLPLTTLLTPRHRRPCRRPDRSRGFTLIELMVVVLIITLMATIAVPGVARRMQSYRSRSAAEEISGVYRTARLRAMGRGAAVLVRFDQSTGSFETREAIQGNAATDPSCAPLPESSCLIPASRWGSNDRSHRIQLRQFASGSFPLTLLLRTPAAPGTVVSSRTSLDVCFTPLGKPYADLTTAGTLEAMTTAAKLNLAPKNGVGIARSVLINPVGPTRVVADE